mmetsp:Transcript_8093/g.7641  ORF Transcript_8093/g.7641 Transcript_8093/m.7641 type:complete len:80 (-) Transcript_8093:26-265(-)
MEDKFNMLKCFSKKMNQMRDLGWRRLKKKMGPITHPQILHHIWLGLYSVSKSQQYEIGPIFDDDDTILQQCCAEQAEIG